MTRFRIGITTAGAAMAVSWACARGIDGPLAEPTGGAGLGGSLTTLTTGMGPGGSSVAMGGGGAGGVSTSSSAGEAGSASGGAGIGGVSGAAGAGSGAGGIGGADIGGAAGTAGTGGVGGSGGTADAGTMPDGGGPRPVGVVVSATANASGQHVASMGGNLYMQSCAANEVVIGYAGSVDAPDSSMTQLRTFRATCASLSVSGDTTFVVNTVAKETLPEVGTMRGPVAKSAACPADQIVVGFRGRSGSDIDDIVLRCAPLTISGASPNFTLSIGAVSESPPLGGLGGNPFNPIDCPAGQVAVGDEGRAAFTINAFGLLCAAVSLDVK